MSIVDPQTLIGVSWAEAPGHADSFTEQARRGVSRWVWCPAAAEWEHPLPLWCERDGRDPVTRSWKEPPAGRHPDTLVRYGLDDRGEVVLALRPDGRGTSPAMWVPARDGGRVHLLFAHRGFGLALVRIAVPEYEDGQLSGFLVAGERGWNHERYTYEDERLVGIDIEYGGSASSPGRHFEIVRDGAGEILLIRLEVGSETSVVYRRREPEELKAARRRVEDGLAAGALAWVERNAPAEPVQTLLLLYEKDGPYVPPSLGIATEPETYTPSELQVYDEQPEEFEALREDFARLDQEWRSCEREDEPARLLTAVAKRIRRASWGKVAPTGPDFLVLAVDSDASDLSRSLEEARKAGTHRE